MARKARRKQTGIISTLLVELSALAGIFGIAQPNVRNNLWQMLQPPTANSQLNQPPQPLTPAASQSQPSTPTNYVPNYAPETYQPLYPSAYTAQAYTAQAVIPRDVRGRSGWKPSGYNPMGSYQ